MTTTLTTHDSQDKVIMPRKLTAENGAKYELIGEFHESYDTPCPDCDEGLVWPDGVDLPAETCETCHGMGTITETVAVSWTTIKAIYDRAVEIFGELIETIHTVS